jgi:hypothetical protein
MKKSLVLSIVFLGITFLPKISNAYNSIGSSVNVGGTFDGTNLIISCASLPVNTPRNEIWAGWSTTTTAYDNVGISVGGVVEPCIGYENIALNKAALTGQLAGIYYYIVGYFQQNDEATSQFGYARITWNGTDVINIDAGTSYFTTQFIFLSPSLVILSSTTPVDFTGDLYLKEQDYVNEGYIRIKYVRQENLQAAVANQELLWRTINLTDTIANFGYNLVSTTSVPILDGDGTYLVKWEYRKPSSWWTSTLSWFNPFASLDPEIIVSSSTSFIFGTTTAFEKTTAQWKADQAEFMASSTASQNVKQYCDLTNSFSFGLCISALFLPTQADIQTSLTDLKEGIGSRFPLGYFKSFIDIVSTTTEGTLTAIDVKLPSALGLGTPSLKLDLTHSLDPILTATTGIFSNSSSTGASSTATFFATTNYYWSLVVYVLTALYILRRIIGGYIIPENFGFGNAPSKTGAVNLKGDEAYKYKEWLYNHKK